MYVNIALQMIPIRANYQDIGVGHRTAVLRGMTSVRDILYFRNCQQFVGFLCKAERPEMC